MDAARHRVGPAQEARRHAGNARFDMSDRLRPAVYAVVLAIAIGWVLYIGQGVFVPVVFAVLVVYVIDGVTRLLFRLPLVERFVPLRVGYAVSAAVIAVVLAWIASLIAANLGGVAALAPTYSASLLNAIQQAAERIGIELVPTWATLRRELLVRIDAQQLLGSTVASVSSIASTLVVVLLYVAFLLIERRAMSAKIAGLSRDPRRAEQIQKVVGHVNARIGAYLALKTLVSAIQGAVTWAILAFLGVELAVFWAVLAGLLNYVPYLGSFLGVALPTAFATMQFAELGAVLAVLLALAASQFLIGFFLDPLLMGNSLNLSPFAILVSLAVWSALWGVPGAFLAVPITACLALVFAEFEGTRPIAVLLSRNGEV
jgi:predicted PurR-regulated permease PerM